MDVTGTSWPRQRRSSMRVIAVVVVAVVALRLTGVIGDSGTPTSAFGGYSWCCGATSISARWAVPAMVTDTAQTQSAATWIGVQDEEGTPFIQVGTQDFNDSIFHSYEAFWSDVAVGFHPQDLGVVDAGDRIAASLAQHGPMWTVTIDDTTRHWSTTIHVHYGTGAPLQVAEWFQEDPTASKASGTLVAYARTTTVRFARVKVNGATPSTDALVQVVMSVPKVTLTPTPFTRDGFSLPT